MVARSPNLDADFFGDGDVVDSGDGVDLDDAGYDDEVFEG